MSDYLIQETPKIMSPSIQTLIEESKFVVFEKDVLEKRDISRRKVRLPVSAILESNFDAGNNFHIIRKRNISLKSRVVN